MSNWIRWVVSAAAFVTGVGILWRTVLNPLRKAGNRAEEMYPLLVALTDVFADHPHYFAVLDDIADQFKTNNGSSLRDVVNDLKRAADDNRQAAEVLKVGVESARVLAERDREQVLRLVLLLDRLDAKVSGGRNALDRIEADRENVAADLVTAQHAVDGIAADVAAGHARADIARPGAGEAADAQARSAIDPATRAWMDEALPERRGGDPEATRAWEAAAMAERRKP